MIPDDADRALRVRSADRFYDLHVHIPMQKIVADMLRPADGHDHIGVAQAREQLQTALAIADRELAGECWAGGDEFSMADCSAAPPLFFINIMMPLAGEFPRVAGYLERMKARRSYARVLQEAEPYLAYFPGNPK